MTRAALLLSLPLAALAQGNDLQPESICGPSTDWQEVELYQGNLGVSEAFVDRHQGPVAQLHYLDNLPFGHEYLANLPQCTASLISPWRA